MINRVLIRIKVLQILFAFYQNKDKSFDAADKELFFSIEKAYDLYFYLLLLSVEITRMYEKRIDIAKNKFLPTDAERNPNLRLANNRLTKELLASPTFGSYLSQKKLSWAEEEVFVKSLLDQILASEIYQEYIAGEDSFAADQAFWVKIYKQIIGRSEELEEVLEEQSVYWNDDVEVVLSFAVKTIKRFDPENPASAFFPMFKNEEDSEFAKKLFRQAYLKEDDYRELIQTNTQNWKLERLAFMDMLIIQIAVAEVLNFPSIPVTVTMNEFIEIAKYYSTGKSSTFVNGILDKIITELRAQGRILK